MKYMLMFCPTEDDAERFEQMSEAERVRLSGEVFAWLQAHKVTSFSRLQPPSSATTIRFNGESAPLVTDGPFIEAKESIGGFAVIDAEDLDTALKMAKTWPPRGIIEVRPVMEAPQR
ncbi:MAG TPA: YciI family protein [Chloroflexota bacterium]|jgi:hypothetical protein|nr:YciI family protein [Chloroflexota bacterium]